MRAGFDAEFKMMSLIEQNRKKAPPRNCVVSGVLLWRSLFIDGICGRSGGCGCRGGAGACDSGDSGGDGKLADVPW